MLSTVGGTRTRALNRIDKRPASLTLTFSVADRSQTKQAGIYVTSCQGMVCATEKIKGK